MQDDIAETVRTSEHESNGVINETSEGNNNEVSKISLPSIPNENKSTNNNLVKTLIKNKTTLWSQAAESVFSESHPFNANKIQENIKENGSYSSGVSSESRQSSPERSEKKNSGKRQSKNDENFNTTVVAPKKKNSETDGDAKKGSPKKQIQQPSSNESKDKKTESPKSSDERKNQPKKKRSSLSLSRQRHSNYINSERLIQLKSKVESAIREHKVYSMTGLYGSVRKALKQRGWVEKIDSDFKGRRRSHRFEEAVDEASFFITGRNDTGIMKESSEHCEAEIVNRMLRNVAEDLCWLSKPYPYCWKDMNKCDMVNRLPKAYFSNKVGLANSLAHLQWYYEDGVCSTQYPRTYNISMRDEYDGFQDDFRLTACVSTLKWLVNNYKQGGESAVRSSDGRVDTSVIDFALKRCSEHVKFKEHDDIDIELPQIWDHQWDQFLTQYYKLVNEGNVLREAKEDPPVMAIVSNAQYMLNQIRMYWPQLDIEGICNWWIVKPGGRCCGNGILIRNHLDQIMAIVSPSVNRETRYVVQKYIEKPLLIYNTKFDIRQWFLVTNVYPLTIWMYKESYLRFCSTTFNLKSTHESIHLCNNAVQRRYKNGKRDTNLPDENMWDCYTFQTYLKAIGYPNVWEDIIYPGMRESFVGALLASQDNMERRRNCFELYGADFMITDQVTDGPWLIEINSNPAMDSSTSVTARMCPQVLEDIVKVVIDRRNDKNAATGAFELAFKQNCPPIPPYLGMSLSIRGRKVYKSAVEPKKIKRPNFSRQSSDSDDSCSSDEENIVQKRCSTDFMQPIKTLREEIARLGQSRCREEFLSVRNDNISDSAANDTDTSRGSTDRRMTLEGKEIELKKKRNRKKRHKTVDRRESSSKFRIEKTNLSQKKDETAVLKKVGQDRTTDYVKRNIENVKNTPAQQLFEKSISHDENKKFLSRSQKNLDFCKDYIFSGQCLEEFGASKKKSYDVLETLFHREIKKIVGNSKDTLKTKDDEGNYIDEFVGESQKLENGPIIITGLWEPSISNVKDEVKSENDLEPPVLGDSFGNGVLKEHLRIDGAHFGGEISIPSKVGSTLSLNLESDKNFLTSPRDLSDWDGLESLRSSTKSLNHIGVSSRHNDGQFENVLKSRYHKGDFTKALNIKAPDLLTKDRNRPTRWQTRKASMEYIREWKYKIDETRKNCEDMLAKLRHFKETNSKNKFQDIIQKRIEEETRLIRKIKQIKSCKAWEKSKCQIKSDEIDREAEETSSRAKTCLAISGESGAVINVNDALPKIYQRNRPLLSSGTVGQSRTTINKSELTHHKATLKKDQLR